MAFFKCCALATVALSSFAAGSPVTLETRAPALDLTLAPTADNAKVLATLTNTGASDLSLLKYGTFLDSAPVQKVSVHSAGKCSQEATI
jgi:deuterolysin